MRNEIQSKSPRTLYNVAGLFFALFIILGGMVIAQVPLVHEFDQAIFSFLKPMDSSATISFMTHLSAIGSPSFNTVLVVLIVAGLFILRYFREGAFIFITFFGGSAFALMIKLLVKRPRPSGKLVVDTGYSFPSGHVFTTAMIVFAIAFLIYRKTNSVLAHDITFVLAGIWVLAIGTARVFLRDHYPSDVLGSILLAGAVLCLAVGLLRQVNAKYQLTASRH